MLTSTKIIYLQDTKLDTECVLFIWLTCKYFRNFLSNFSFTQFSLMFYPRIIILLHYCYKTVQNNNKTVMNNSNNSIAKYYTAKPKT